MDLKQNIELRIQKMGPIEASNLQSLHTLHYLLNKSLYQIHKMQCSIIVPTFLNNQRAEMMKRRAQTSPINTHSSSLALYALDRVITAPGQNKLRQNLSLAFPSTDDNFPGN